MPRNAYKQIDVFRSIRNRALCRLGQVPNSTSQHFQESSRNSELFRARSCSIRNKIMRTWNSKRTYYGLDSTWTSVPDSF